MQLCDLGGQGARGCLQVGVVLMLLLSLSSLSLAPSASIISPYLCGLCTLCRRTSPLCPPLQVIFRVGVQQERLTIPPSAPDWLRQLIERVSPGGRLSPLAQTGLAVRFPRLATSVQ